MWCWINGRYEKLASATVSAMSRVTKYADGCFETIRYHHEKIAFLHEHVERLEKGMDFLGFSKPGRINAFEMQAIFQELLHRNHLIKHQARLRIQVWRDGGEAYSAKRTTGPIYLLSAQMASQNLSPTYCVFAKTPRIPSSIIPASYKFSAALNYMLAQKEADDVGADEAIMSTITQCISETSMANLFWMKDEVFYTPHIDCDVLPGITRSNLIRFLKNNGNQVVEGTFERENLLQAQHVFTTNAMRGIRPVGKIEHVSFETKPVLQWAEAFEAHIWSA